MSLSVKIVDLKLSWVRLIDGKLHLTRRNHDNTTTTRPLTITERIMWRLAARTPKR